MKGKGEDMKNNKLVKELKNRDRNIYRALNQCYGFNFEQPFTITKIVGAFTINKILKTLGSEHTPEKSLIVALTVNGSRYLWRKDKLMSVDIHGAGVSDFNIAHVTKWFNFPTALDNYFAKGDFNDDRKTAECVYIIAQNRELLSGSRKEIVPDMTERIEVIETSKTIKNYKQPNEYSYISKIKFLDKGHKGARLETSVPHWTGEEPRELSEIVDKSGYYLIDKRTDLKSRANGLRKERAAEAFKATDNRAIIDGLQGQLYELKNMLCEKLKDATTGDEIREIGYKLSMYSGLSGMFSDLESIRKGENEKTFTSVATFNNRVNDLRHRMDEMNKTIKELRKGA